MTRARLEPRSSLRKHNPVTVPQGVEQAGNLLGRVLKVRIQDHNDLALGCRQPLDDRAVLPSVLRHLDHLDAPITLGALTQPFEGSVAARIVDEDEVIALDSALESLGQSLMELG